MEVVAPDTREGIAVIGGGLGGCLTALMLARTKDERGKPKYKVKLIEAQDTLLNGASTIASRLHLGMEYPLSPETAKDCLTAAVVWKLIMPEDIYTQTPPMKFLLTQETQNTNQLTLEKYHHAFEVDRKNYEKIFKYVQHSFQWDEATTQKKLFGDYHGEADGVKDPFFRPLKPEEWEDYSYGPPRRLLGRRQRSDVAIAGGFQSHEIGINVPRYLTMIQAELEKQQRDGNIEILTRHKVKKQGIEGDFRNFTIHFENGQPDVHASQVVQAAWQGGPEIMPTPLPEDHQNWKVTVHKRAMLMIDLPPDWTLPPAFIMLDDKGGMMAPYGNKQAICYLPTPDAAYFGRHTELTSEETSLPVKWGQFSKHEKENWTNKYFKKLKERFPALQNATNPRLILRDTLTFHKTLAERQHTQVQEYDQPMADSGTTSSVPRLTQELKMKQEMFQEFEQPPMVELTKGLFTLYPLKGTYAVLAALQAEEMVYKRSENPEVERVESSPALVQKVLKPQFIEQYTLQDMPNPTPEIYARFYAAHPDLPEGLHDQGWPVEHSTAEDKQSWSKKISGTDKGQGQTR